MHTEQDGDGHPRRVRLLAVKPRARLARSSVDTRLCEYSAMIERMPVHHRLFP